MNPWEMGSGLRKSLISSARMCRYRQMARLRVVIPDIGRVVAVIQQGAAQKLQGH